MRYTIFTTLSVATVLCLSLMNSCSKQETVESEISSFDLIQDKILTKSCAVQGCHFSENDGAFAQHGLVLAKGKAYNNLYEIEPKNNEARNDGLKLVKAFNALQSLLYHKLNTDNS